jgi:hypothetical protein
MTERELSELIIRIQKLDLDLGLRAIVEEAAQLLTAGRAMEAEALLQNVEARFYHGVSGNGIAAAGAGSGISG